MGSRRSRSVDPITVITDPARGARSHRRSDTIAALKGRGARPHAADRHTSSEEEHPKCQYPIGATPQPRIVRLVTTVAKSPVEGRIERVAFEEIELAPNARRDISQEGIHRLAGLFCRTGQLIPCIGHRPNPEGPRPPCYDGQRRYLAAELAASSPAAKSSRRSNRLRTA